MKKRILSAILGILVAFSATGVTALAEGGIGELPVGALTGNVDGEPTDDEPIDGEPTDDEPIDDEPIDGEPTDGEPIDGEPIDDEPTDDEPTDGEPTDDVPATDVPVAANEGELILTTTPQFSGTAAAPNEPYTDPFTRVTGGNTYVTIPKAASGVTVATVKEPSVEIEGVATFDAGQRITYSQAAQMILEALGYLQENQDEVDAAMVVDANHVPSLTIITNTGKQDSYAMLVGQEKVLAVTEDAAGSVSAVVKTSSTGITTHPVKKGAQVTLVGLNKAVKSDENAGRTFAPAGEIARLVGIASSWDEATKTATFSNQ